MFKPLNDPARIRSMIGDIAEILRIVDAVLTAEEGAGARPSKRKRARRRARPLRKAEEQVYCSRFCPLAKTLPSFVNWMSMR